MITTKTTFVVGAGASAEFDFPLGRDLATRISKALDFANRSHNNIDKELVRGAIVQLTHRQSMDSRLLFSKCGEVSGRLHTANSIDALIDNFSHDDDFAQVGKLAIASCLVETERAATKLRPPNPGQTFDLRLSSDTWLAHLFDILANRVQVRAVEKIFENVSFVIFNYDRCVEHYLQHALASRFGMTLDDAYALVDKAAIVHPYGSLGKLHSSAFGLQLEPGVQPAGDTILKMADGLLTFSESQFAPVEPSSYVSWAERLVFLGFAFHPQNVGILKGQGNVTQAVATTFGMSETSRKSVVDDIHEICGRPQVCTLDNLSKTKCAQFILDEHRFIER